MAIIKSASHLKAEAEALAHPDVKAAIQSSSGGVSKEHDPSVPKLGGVRVTVANASTIEEIRSK